VNHIVKAVPLLTLRVSPGDQAAAQRAVEAVTEDGRSSPIEVLADPTLALGSCVFESDQGVIDAGLETQLAAIERAVQRASQQVPETADAAEAAPASLDDIEADAEPAVNTQAEAQADIDTLAFTEIDTPADDEAPNEEFDATALPDDTAATSPMQAA
jgi:Flagellar assembly protein FliH